MKQWWIVAVVLLMLVASAPLNVSARVVRISEAIARAEGFYVAGSLPQRRNNPGSISVVIGGRPVLNQYASVADGWQALYDQVERMLSGNSAFYRPDMSIEQIAAIYTGGDNPSGWARIVAGQLGVPVSMPIGQVA